MHSAHCSHSYKEQGNRKSAACLNSESERQTPLSSVNLQQSALPGKPEPGKPPWKCCRAFQLQDPPGALPFTCHQSGEKRFGKGICQCQGMEKGPEGTLWAVCVAGFLGTVIPCGVRTGQISVCKGHGDGWIHTHPAPPPSRSPRHILGVIRRCFTLAK